MIMAVIALLVGRSQSLASLHPVLSMSSTRASNSYKPKVLPNVSTRPTLYVVFRCHSKSIARVLPLKLSKLLYMFCVPVLDHEEVLGDLLCSHV